MLAEFTDAPEALTFGVDEDEAPLQALDALEAALSQWSCDCDAVQSQGLGCLKPPGKQQTLFDELTVGTSPCPALVLLAYISQRIVGQTALPTPSPMLVAPA